MPDDLKLLRELTALPTAAFLEDEVLAHVDAWAKRRKNLKVETDRFGNRLISTKGKGPRMVFVAHADHPAFMSNETVDGVLHAEFRGGVLAECCVPGTKVRFGEVVAAVIKAEADDKKRLVGATFKLPRGTRVAPGIPGNFDFGRMPSKVRGKRLVARACDDLAGLAACLESLDRVRSRAKAPVAVLVTRAEEVGFIGAIAAVKQKTKGLLRKDDRIISIETSAAQPAAPMGEGCVLRVGDKTSVFHSGLTDFLHRRCQALAEKDKTFKFNRALMPGGTCEATAFDAFGHIAAAACVPLASYHNMDREKKRMAAEEIDLNDWRSLVKLLADAGLHSAEFDGKPTALQKSMTDRFNQHVRLFAKPHLSIRGEAGPGAD
ncbi:MAG: M20/M25/M40 family metallo-hydrolase [Planctomycetota bacterium]